MTQLLVKLFINNYKALFNTLEVIYIYSRSSQK